MIALRELHLLCERVHSQPWTNGVTQRPGAPPALLDSTRRKIERATDAYRHAELHLAKPDPEGQDAFHDANYTLRLTGEVFDIQFHLQIAWMNNHWAPLQAFDVLIAMRSRVAAILTVKSAPPRRVGPVMVIEGHELILSEQLARLLEFGLREGGAPFDTLRAELFDINEPTNEIRARVTKLDKRLCDEMTARTPFRITFETDDEILVARVIPKADAH